MQILYADDDRELVDLVGFALRRAGFEVLPAHDAPSALKLLAEQQPALAVLDVNLGVWNGFELLRDLRRQSEIPVIMLSGRAEEADKVRGLELGADDYVTKPFSHRELLARVRANLRRQGHQWTAPAAAAATLQVGPLRLNLAEHALTRQDQPIELTVTEFRLLHYLMLNAGSVVPTRAILQQVWGYQDPDGSDVVRVAVYRLRRKLEDDPRAPRLLQTVPGVGILLRADPL
jgi:two-component system, OmpR family, response regulator VicR